MANIPGTWRRGYADGLIARWLIDMMKPLVDVPLDHRRSWQHHARAQKRTGQVCFPTRPVLTKTQALRGPRVMATIFITTAAPDSQAALALE